MPRLNQNQRIQALTMLARGDNVSNVSRAFGCHRNTIFRLRQRFQQTGGVADRPRPGRPRVTNPPTDRFITLRHLRRRFQTATSSARQYGISKQTVLCRLRQARQPIRPKRPCVGQVLTARHRAARLQWAQRHFRWGRPSPFLRQNRILMKPEFKV
jgi:transposase-like protein